MPLKELVQKRIVSCPLGTTIKACADQMKDSDVGAVLIIENRKPLGIVTDRDIVLRCICENLPTDRPVDEIMTRTLHTVKVEHGLQDVIRMMRKERIRRVPVVDESGYAVGLVSFGDIVGLLAKELGEISVDTAVKSAA